MTLGEMIKEYRRETGCSMDSFAKKCGLSKAYVSILERNHNPVNGKPTVPSIKTIKAVSVAMGKDFDDVFVQLDPDQKVALGVDVDLLSYLKEDHESGRLAAREEMYRLFGVDHSAADQRYFGQKTAVLYYNAVDRRSAPELLDIIIAVEDLDYTELENIRMVVRSYLCADAPIREIVDTALKPYKRNEFDEIPEYKMAARKSDKTHSTIGPDTDVEI